MVKAQLRKMLGLMFYKYGPQKPLKVWNDENGDQIDDENIVYGSYCRIIDGVVVKINQIESE